MASVNLGIIGDQGDYRVNGSRFYYNTGALWLSPNRNYSTGPALGAIAGLVKSFGKDIVTLGDNTYVSGSSSLVDEVNGRFFNDYMAPYPSPKLIDKNGPYRKDNGNRVWPYDLYDYPNGFANPLTGSKGGSQDGKNHYWPAIGNHDYGLRLGYQEVNISKGPFSLGKPKAPSSTAVPQPFVDYFPWLTDATLAGTGNDAAVVKTGKVDTSGNSGIYYSVELGNQDNGDPLVEIFAIDTPRLFLNAGVYDVFTNGYGLTIKDLDTSLSDGPNYSYDPSQPFVSGSNTAAVLTTDAANGQAQFDWLKSGLEESKAKWKVIIGHHPAYSSGAYGASRIDDHASTPLIQKLLDGLPSGSFDAYLNGHSHYYQRVLEGNDQGIGQGIPFITLGNSGRQLYAINETRYGDNVYKPSNQTGDNDEFEAFSKDFLLASEPLTTGVSGGYLVKDAEGKDIGFNEGAYGFGFGAVKTEIDDGLVFFNYRQSNPLDPAITENLTRSTRNQSLKGWRGLQEKDWRPDISDSADSQTTIEQTARIQVTFDINGSVKESRVINSGDGYMSNKKRHVVDFEVRGNDALNSDDTNNPNQYGILRLVFRNGSLKRSSVLDNGAGYTFTMQGEESTNKALKKPVKLEIPLNISLAQSWYGQEPNNYQDWYLITDTIAVAQLNNAGNLEISMLPKSARAREIIDSQNLTTGYSGQGAQASYPQAQKGTVSAWYGQTKIGTAELVDGIATFSGENLPISGESLTVEFSGDPLTSYQVNYKGSQTETIVKPFLPNNLSRSSFSEKTLTLLGDNSLVDSYQDANDLLLNQMFRISDV